MNEDANAKLIRELKEEIQKLRELLKNEGIEIREGTFTPLINFMTVFIFMSSYFSLLLIKLLSQATEVLRFSH